MKKVFVSLNTIDKVKAFADKAMKLDSSVNMLLSSEKYTVDARSILGIFSLNLNNPLTLELEGTSEKEEAIVDAIREYLV